MITTDNRTGDGKISEALELLNEAARVKKNELQELLTDKYQDIKKAIATESEEILVKGKEKLYETIRDTDLRAHKDPWRYIASAAAVSLVIGYLVGKCK